MGVEEMLKASVEQLEKFLTTKTVVGEPIVIGEVSLVPIQTVSFGYGSGGGEGGDGANKGVGGGGGAGASLKPIAIVAVKGTDVQVYTLGKKGAADNIATTLAAYIPEAISKIRSGKGKKHDKECEDEGEKE